MQGVLRPYVTAGIAVVGAGLIAVTPVAPPPPEPQQYAVQLSAAGFGYAADVAGILQAISVAPAGQDYPLATPVQLFTDTVANLQGLGSEIAANPAPILAQLVANQVSYANDMVTAAQAAGSNLTATLQELPRLMQNISAELAQGDVYNPVTSLWDYGLNLPFTVVRPMLDGLTQVAQGMAGNLDNLVASATQFVNATSTLATTPLWVQALVTAPFYPMNATVAAAAGVTQDVVNAVDTGNYPTALADLAYALPTLANAYLNGYSAVRTATYGADLAIRGVAFRIPPEFGLLTNFTTGSATALVARGTIQNLLSARDFIAQALGAPAASRALAQVVEPAMHAAQATLAGSLNSGMLDPAGVLSAVAALTPATLMADLSAMVPSAFDPAAATANLSAAIDAGNLGTLLDPALITEISAALLNLFP